MFHFHYAESEVLEHLGWVAKVCLRCRCIRAFMINAIVEKTGTQLGLFRVASSRRTNSCVTQCDFCGFSVRQKPKRIDTSWDPSRDFGLLIRSTLPEASAEPPPTADLDSVAAMLSEQILATRSPMTSLRTNFRLLAVCYFALQFISLFGLVVTVVRQAPHFAFNWEPAFQAAIAACILIPAVLALLLFRMITGRRYRLKRQAIIDARRQHLAQRYHIGQDALDRLEEQLAPVG
jgi:hypothetical protein